MSSKLINFIKHQQVIGSDRSTFLTLVWISPPTNRLPSPLHLRAHLTVMQLGQGWCVDLLLEGLQFRSTYLQTVCNHHSPGSKLIGGVGGNMSCHDSKNLPIPEEYNLLCSFVPGSTVWGTVMTTLVDYLFFRVIPGLIITHRCSSTLEYTHGIGASGYPSQARQGRLPFFCQPDASDAPI